VRHPRIMKVQEYGIKNTRKMVLPLVKNQRKVESEEHNSQVVTCGCEIKLHVS
jgi:hypothetical protein